MHTETTRLFKESTDETIWKRIREDDAYVPFRENLKKAWKHCTENSLVPLSFDLYMIYTRNGSNNEYGKAYFPRRLALNSSFMSYMIYREDKYLKKLEEVIMLILDEYTWALPNHIKDIKDCEAVTTYLDLFAAETGHALSEILYILGDKLDRRVSSRIRYEVNRRIISSYLNRCFPFEESKSNWATVCAGSIGMTFLYMAPEKFELIKARIESCFLNYLDGFDSDGACPEGVGYWVYGFGYYIYFEELYKDFSGKYLIPMGEKHKQIAMFLQRAHIKGHKIISFSDGSQEEFIMNGLVFKLNEIFGDDVRILPYDTYAPPVMGGDNCYRFAHCIRNFLWHNPNKLPKDYKASNETIYLEDAQWYIKKTDLFMFAAKCGGNDDPHNHNDVGSFIISDYNKQLLADIGKGEYNRGYFDPETRYNNLCCASRGHSVPIVDNKEQLPGREYCGRVLNAIDDCISMDISGAYGNNNLTSLVRSFSFKEREIILSDEINLKTNTVWTERFVSLTEPLLKEDAVVIDGVRIYNNIGVAPQITVEKMLEHGFDQRYIPVYLIDYKTDAKRAEFTFRF